MAGGLWEHRYLIILRTVVDISEEADISVVIKEYHSQEVRQTGLSKKLSHKSFTTLSCYLFLKLDISNDSYTL